MQNEIVYLYLDDIIPNRFQPREIFDDEALKELAISIKEHGVIQPIIVRQVNNKYEIIAGERRYKAATMAGLTKIPAIVKDLDDKESSKVALIENLQRRDLTPIEEARTYQKILDLDNMTQDALAQTMGKTQSAVSNKLRLLALPDEVQDALLKEQISERHARSLLNVPNKNDQIRLLEKIISTRMTVKELDKEIKMLSEQGNGQPVDVTKVPSDFNLNNAQVAEPPKEVYTSSANSNMNLNPMGLPTPISSIPTTENTTAQAPSAENSFLNPTMVDINQIRENASDINGSDKPGMDVSELMRVTPKEEPKNDFKFIPGAIPNAKETAKPEPMPTNPSLFGFGNIATPATSEPTNNTTNEMNNMASFDPLAAFMTPPPSPADTNKALPTIDSLPSFDSTFPTNNLNTPASLPSMDPLASTAPANNNLNVSSTPLNLGPNSFLNQFGLNSSASAGKNVQDAVSDIKNAVQTAQSKGYTVHVEESDQFDKYQIIINIDKK